MGGVSRDGVCDRLSTDNLTRTTVVSEMYSNQLMHKYMKLSIVSTCAHSMVCVVCQ